YPHSLYGPVRLGLWQAVIWGAGLAVLAWHALRLLRARRLSTGNRLQATPPGDEIPRLSSVSRLKPAPVPPGSARLVRFSALSPLSRRILFAGRGTLPLTSAVVGTVAHDQHLGA